jgi:hypothetical protein
MERLTPLALSNNSLIQVQRDLILFNLELKLSERLRDNEFLSVGAKLANHRFSDIFALKTGSYILS